MCWVRYAREVVELSRKLALTGIITLFERGSIIQSVLATCISFFFFALTVKEQPFKKRHLNLIKTFTEIQLFGILLIIIVLQTNSRGLKAERLGEYGWGMLQIIITASMLPVILVSCGIGLRDLREQHETHMASLKSSMSSKTLGSFVNPVVADDDSDAED